MSTENGLTVMEKCRYRRYVGIKKYRYRIDFKKVIATQHHPAYATVSLPCVVAFVDGYESSCGGFSAMNFSKLTAFVFIFTFVDRCRSSRYCEYKLV